MNSNNFERIKILFFGSNWSHAEVISLTDFHEERMTFNHQGDTQGNTDCKILGVEITANRILKQRILKIINENFPGKISDYYFFVKKRKHIRPIMDIIGELSLGIGEVYGIDPDYYYSLVPLSSTNHKLVEKYILSLKSDFSKKGFIKHMIKQFLININLSYNLYESFIIIVSRKQKRQEFN